MPNQIFTIARYTLIESMRNRFAWLILLVVLCGFLIAEFTGDIVITDHRQIQSALLGSFVRYGSVLIMAIMVVSSSLREMQDKTLELILATAVSRTSWYLGKWCGFALMCLFITLPILLLLLLYASWTDALIWSISLYLELLIVISLSLAMVFSFRQLAVALTAVLLFYLLARSISSMMLIAQGPLTDEGASHQFISGFMQVLFWILPDMQRFTPVDWLVYGHAVTADLFGNLIQAIVYCALLAAVALFDFYRKNLHT